MFFELAALFCDSHDSKVNPLIIVAPILGTVLIERRLTDL